MSNSKHEHLGHFFNEFVPPEKAVSHLRMVLIPAIAALTLVVLGPLFLGAQPVSADGSQPPRMHREGDFSGGSFHHNALFSLYIDSLLPPLVPIPGQYCSDKTGGESFVPTGVQPDAGVTCPAVPPSAAAPTPPAS